MSTVDLPVLVVGGGGHAKVVIDVLQKVGREIIGIVDGGVAKGTMVLGVPVLGGDEYLSRYTGGGVDLANGIGSLPGCNARWEVTGRLRQQGYRFIRVIHPSVILGACVDISEGVQIMAGCVIQPCVTVGEDTILNTGTTVDHDCRIGRCCHVAPGVSLCGGVCVGDFVHIGTGANIIQEVTISAEKVVKAGALVSVDLV